MKKSVKITLSIVLVAVSVASYLLYRRYGYKRLGTEQDKGLIDADLEKKIKQTDFSQVSYLDYNVNDVVLLNDLDLVASWYVTNSGYENYSDSERKKMVTINAVAKEELIKRKLWKTAWLNEPIFGASNRDLYNRTGQILGID